MYKKTSNVTIGTKQALSKAQFICSRQEKCCYDIRKKLQEWGISHGEQEEIIESLIDEKYIDEERYASFYVRDKFRFNKWGRIKITHHLKQKQIQESIINNAIEQIDDAEYQKVLKAVLTSKAKTLRGDEGAYQKKAKLVRFASSKGFEPQIILDLLNQTF